MAIPWPLIGRLLMSGTRATRAVTLLVRLRRFKKIKRAYDRFNNATDGNNVRIVVDEEKLAKSIGDSLTMLDKFYAYTKAEVFGHMKTEMGDFSGFCAMETPPFDAGGLEVGQDRIERDIKSAFMPLSAIPFASLVLAQKWSLVEAYGYEFKSKRWNDVLRKRQWDKLFALYTRPTLIVSPKMGKPVPYQGGGTLVKTINERIYWSSLDRRTMLRNHDITFLVSGKDAKDKIKAFIVEMKRKVGKMANGWVICYRKLKGRGYTFPALMTNATNGKVVLTENLEQGKPMVVQISNVYGNVNGWMNDTRGIHCKDYLFSNVTNIMNNKARQIYLKNKAKYLNQ